MDSETRYQVFVSSTYLDLMEERAAVVSALLNLDAFPTGMELFPAADDEAWTLIEDVIADSDYYLLIIGGKYGSIDPKLDISFTEREFDTAVRLKKPVMAFLHGDPGKLLAERTEGSDELREKLAAFRRKVEKAKHVKYWKSPEELAGMVALSWPAFRKRYSATGWIKADQGTSSESLAALAKAQKEIDDLRGQLETVRTQAPPGTDDLAQGDGTLRLSVYALGTWSGGPGHPRRQTGAWVEIETTWDRVFGYMGLRMMQEADEPTLEDDLCILVRMDHTVLILEAFEDKVAEDASAAKAKDHASHLEDVEVTDEDFQTILLQFAALGLIQHSKRQRSVKDTANYWSLTPYGNTRLVRLRAIQSGEQTLLRAEGLELQASDAPSVLPPPSDD